MPQIVGVHVGPARCDSPGKALSYKVLALKYRPSTFDEVVGQTTVTRTLRNAIEKDRIGHAFSGKYKSLFIVNTGPIEKRLGDLQDAIAEVYASVFHPDPIEYRRDRGLIDFQEQMGILIQEVVGNEVGGMLFPLFAGVAFSVCEMRWSPRIRRTDGVARLVLGLGTRAVDRTVPITRWPTEARWMAVARPIPMRPGRRSTAPSSVSVLRPWTSSRSTTSEIRPPSWES